MSSLISKNIIVGIINDLRAADMQVKSAITSFYNLLNADLSRSVKREDALNWELRPISAKPIIDIDENKMPCIGVEIKYGLTTNIMEGEFIDLFVVVAKCKFKKDDCCDFKATICYDLLVDPVKPSFMEDLIMLMRQYFKECRRMIENIWVNQVIETMKMSLGTNDEEPEPAEDDAMDSQQIQSAIPSATIPPRSSMDKFSFIQQSSPSYASQSGAPAIPMIGGAASSAQRVQTIPKESVSSTKSEIEQALQPKQKSGGIIRRRNNGGGKKPPVEFDLSASSSQEEEKFPSPAAAATPQTEGLDSVSSVEDEDDDSPPPIPKLPVLDGSKLKQ